MLQTLSRILGLLGLSTPDETDSQRTLLWDTLRDAHVTDGIQFVGSTDSNTEACVSTGVWDHHHEGHGGFTAVDIAANNLVGWLEASKPDVVMFMLGTNDITHRHDTAVIIDAYTEMVGQMRDSNDGMRIIVDLLLPLSGNNAGVVALNAEIFPWAESLNSTDPPIYIADMNTGFADSDERDGVRPNAEGDRKIAGRLYPILLQIIEQNCEASNALEYLAGYIDGALDEAIDGDEDEDEDEYDD
ncbi:hypothetical protein LSUB1_G002607 [Lachnellula subtilissima]|uniref:SGNH hydrolase-type esterase domain-containing protein n=1 Tax=Lachnellula subtilissima TaxID=602034 RepID=A0A8H8RVE3_9HELO|nr:hypothetical protein LSUB1_G002607 [Lachnellula subtilissima]